MDNPTSMVPALTDLSGTTLGEFKLQRRLGQGGMGQVYLAEQMSLKRKVAVKVMRGELTANETAVKRFRAEAEAVARLTHPNIVQIYAIGNHEGMPYIALEFVDGTNLASYLKKKGAMPLGDAVLILRKVAAALQHAGENGIAHRDIKPENILITRQREVKVTDFGLARSTGDEQQAANLTQSGVILGTPMYMSPEQVHGRKVDPRTDIYSLGVTAYHMLAGQPPYKGESAFELAIQHVQSSPKPLQKVRPDLPGELCDIVARMMAKEPAERFASGKELAQALAGVRASAGRKTQELLELPDDAMNLPTVTPVSDEELAPTLKQTRLTKLKRKKKRQPVVLVALAAVAALAVVALAVGVLQWKKHARQQSQPVAQGPAPSEVPPANIPPQPQPTPQPVPPQRPTPQPVPPQQPTPQQPPPNPNPRPRTGATEEEKRLLRMIAQEFNPREPRAAMAVRAEMGAFLIRQNRVAEAETFFKDLSQSKGPPVMNLLGQVGQGITLSIQGKHKESNDMFRKAHKAIPPGFLGKPMSGAFFNVHLVPLVQKALETNAKVDPLGPELKEVLKEAERIAPFAPQR